MVRTRKKILVVEDQEVWRDILSGILEGEGYDVDVAENYQEALDKLSKERFDLVTVDITLPDESDLTGMGKMLLDRISSSGLEARTIVVTGWEKVDTTVVRNFFKDYKTYGFFWKADFSPRRFRESVRTALEEQLRPERLLDPILDFFAAAGFEVRDVAERECILEPRAPRNRRRLGPLVYVRIEPEQVVKRKDIEAIVETVRARYDSQISDRTAFIVLERPPDYGARYQMQTYRFSDRFVIVPFSVPQLRQALQSDSCPAVLEEVLGAYLGETDLYDFHSPVSDVLSFFGRERVLNTIKHSLNNGDHVGLFGFRKMGKTSLLNYLRDQVPYPVAVLSLQDVREPIHIYRTAVEEWTKSLQLQFPEMSISGLFLMRSSVPDDPEAAFNADVQTLLSLVGGRRVPQRFVLCLDEIDEIVPSNDSSDSSIATFRKLMGFLRGISTRLKALNLIVCGMNPSVNRVNRWRGQSNPVFQSFREIFLGPFSKKEENDEMVKSIGAHMGVEYDSSALERLYRESAGHPYITRQMCSLAVAKAPRRPYSFTEDDIASAADAYLRSPKTVVYLEQEMWGTLRSQTEVAILKALASHQPQTEIELIPEDLPTNERRARQTALASMKERWLINKAGENGYFIPYGCFYRWIRLSLLGAV